MTSTKTSTTDEMFYVTAFWNAAKNDTVRQLLIKTVRPIIVKDEDEDEHLVDPFMLHHDNEVFHKTNAQWLSKWQNLNRHLPPEHRFKKKPSWSAFCDAMILASETSGLRILKSLMWLCEKNMCPLLFAYPSTAHKLGYI